MEKKQKKSLLFEVAWEVCNQVGGIYTVIRSKVPAMVDQWGDEYVCLGPYFPQRALTEYEPITSDDGSGLYQVVQKMREEGLVVEYGYWLITGKPRVVLFDIRSMMPRLDAIKYGLWERHQISTVNIEDLVNQTLCFGEMVRMFLTYYAQDYARKFDITAHFHEWMASSGLPDLRRDDVRVATVFTTHATMLGRYIASNERDFYHKLPFF